MGFWNDYIARPVEALFGIPGDMFGPPPGPMTVPADKAPRLPDWEDYCGLGHDAACDAARDASGIATLHSDPEAFMDRAAAHADLEGMFDVVKEGEAAKPNQVTAADLDKMVALYSDIRLGRTDLQLDGGALDPLAAEQFREGAMQDIAKIMQTPSGRDLLLELAYQKDRKEAHTTTIGYSNEALAAGEKPVHLSSEVKDMYNGVGMDSGVSYAPGVNVDLGDIDGPGKGTRSDVALYHELTHALHRTRGDYYYNRVGFADHNFFEGFEDDGVTSTNIAELQTTGVGSSGDGKRHFADEKLSENAYRRERRALGEKVPARTGYQNVKKTKIDFEDEIVQP